ncbi:MAG: hypothetical protein RSA94_05225, partial [Mucinivorans sp.]
SIFLVCISFFSLLYSGSILVLFLFYLRGAKRIVLVGDCGGLGVKSMNTRDTRRFDRKIRRKQKVQKL